MNQYDVSHFLEDLSELNINLNKVQIEQFIVYYEMLIEWNQMMNLTAITEYEDVMKKHFIDSLSLKRAYDLSQSVRVIDIGTGAGFPGLALKIAFPKLQITLLDSLNKRIRFLDAVINKLKITGVEAIHGRAEDLAKNVELREHFDLCVSRAVANLSTLSEYCIPFVKKGGFFISYKSEKLADEIGAAENAISLLGGRVENQIDFYLPKSDIYRNLVVVKKERQTPKKYPRKSGVPTREPLK